jgi:hypothetical protein
MTEKPWAFLSLVKVLEKSVGHKTGYGLLEPFPCTTLERGQPAVVPIQKAGKVISQHIGLADFTFIISVTAHDANVAGHIELAHDGDDVFVELSRDVCEYKDAVLATLCHELCHKFLHVNGIKHGTDRIEQEFLNDVAAVYLGLGKIMLNGCACESSQTRTEGNRTTTTTHTFKTGYISRECFAFVYRLVCAMRGISSEMFLAGLSPAAREAVLKCEREYCDWFRPEYRVRENVAKLADDLNNAVVKCQDDAAVRHQIVRRVEKQLEAVRVRINEVHKPLVEAQQKILEMAQPEPNPHLSFIRCLESRESIAECISRSEYQLQDLWLEGRQIEAVASSLPQVRHAEASEIVECPSCGANLRVPENRKRLLVTCSSSTCKYKFIVNTASEPEVSTKSDDVPQSGFLKSLKAVFGRR